MYICIHVQLYTYSIIIIYLYNCIYIQWISYTCTIIDIFIERKLSYNWSVWPDEPRTWIAVSIFKSYIFIISYIYIISLVLWFYDHLQIYKLFLVYFYCYLKWQPTKVLSWITIKVTVVLSPDRNSIMWMECQSSWPPAFDRWQERAGEQGFTLITYFLSDPPPGPAGPINGSAYKSQICLWDSNYMTL